MSVIALPACLDGHYRHFGGGIKLAGPLRAGRGGSKGE